MLNFIVVSSPFLRSIHGVICLFLIPFFFLLNGSFTNQCSSFLFLDHIAISLSFMLILVLFLSVLAITWSSSYSWVFPLLFLSCLMVFCSSHSLVIFFFYEASLFPIIYIILKWGSYPERSLSSFMLLIYTLVFTLPMLWVVLSLFYGCGTFSLPLAYLSSPLESPLFVFITFFAFCVNLPIYGLHFWLPMAHVEAPTFGSMILAGALLKLGGAGILRFMYLFDFDLLRYYVCGYSVVFLSFSTLVCCVQSDFNRLIAYSSVNHMIALLPLFLINTVSSDYTATLLIVLHGLSSPLLFFLVGLVYELFSTRQLVLLRGLCTVSPLLTLAMTFGFFFNVSAPPLPSFIPEVLFFAISVGISPYFVPSLLVFALLSMVYNLNWFSSSLFNSHLNWFSSSLFLTLNSSYVVFLFMLYSAVFLFLLLSASL